MDLGKVYALFEEKARMVSDAMDAFSALFGNDEAMLHSLFPDAMRRITDRAFKTVKEANGINPANERMCRNGVMLDIYQIKDCPLGGNIRLRMDVPSYSSGEGFEAPEMNGDFFFTNVGTVGGYAAFVSVDILFNAKIFTTDDGEYLGSALDRYLNNRLGPCIEQVIFPNEIVPRTTGLFSGHERNVWIPQKLDVYRHGFQCLQTLTPSAVKFLRDSNLPSAKWHVASEVHNEFAYVSRDSCSYLRQNDDDSGVVPGFLAVADE